ncbi:hypothetical protein V473_12655 [Sphingobium cupriresistens LL01]|uniref:Uncharacterized protein n=1 Tax=Sphingobium cupriresistens LL01 TaxID=1420583 RepID=A0A0J7XWG0_9SPHN|nr:hypothetical protein V473_12655 [Sphingobium cupriresistens LL01]
MLTQQHSCTFADIGKGIDRHGSSVTIRLARFLTDDLVAFEYAVLRWRAPGRLGGAISGVANG